MLVRGADVDILSHLFIITPQGGKMKKITIVGMILFVTAFFIIDGCKKGGEEAKKAPEAETIEPTKKVEDYLDAGVVLALYLWEGNFYGAEFFPAKIITQATEETKGEYQIELKYENQMIKHWTKNVIFKSHPATKEELKIGMVVLYTGGDPQPQRVEDLKHAKWGRGVILSTDELHEDIVELEGGEYRRKYKRHLTAIRIIDKAPKQLTEIPKEE